MTVQKKNLKDLYEDQVEDRQTALYSAWLIAVMREPEEIRSRLARHNCVETPMGAAFMKLVDQYHYFITAYRGHAQMVACNRADDAFSEAKGWRSLASMGAELKDDNA